MSSLTCGVSLCFLFSYFALRNVVFYTSGPLYTFKLQYGPIKAESG